MKSAAAWIVIVGAMVMLGVAAPFGLAAGPAKAHRALAASLCDSAYKGQSVPAKTLQALVRSHEQWLDQRNNPEFHRADLCQADMRQATLAGANLERAQLEGALLRQANLHQAILIQASLAGADLTKALVNDGNISGADLRRTRLDAADLRRANLKGASLSSVTGLTQAQLDTACVDDQTALPADLSRPAPCTAVTKETQP
jgi:hypothetical protein